MIKHSRLATAIAIVAPIAIATAGQSVAASAHSGASALKASSAAPVTKVQYFYNYGPYVYRPVYQYNGYTYWYPFSSWAYAGYYSYW
jgi:hypothetical protein